MNGGWIKLHRKIKDSWIFESPEYLKAWIIILLEANHKDNKCLIGSEAIECKRGQSLNSLKTWSNLFNFSIQNTRTFFKNLENDEMINTQGLRKSTRLTILNYDSYQSSPTDNQQANQQAIYKNAKKEDVNDFIKQNPLSLNVVNSFLCTLEKDDTYRPDTEAKKLKWLKCAQWAINKMDEVGDDKYGEERVRDIIKHFRTPEETENGKFNWADHFKTLLKLKKQNPEGVFYLFYFWEEIKEGCEYGKENR